MTRDAAIALAKKLKTLAEKAMDGERKTALSKLSEFCAKHSLDSEDYSIESIKAVIPYKTEQEKMLLSSIMCMVLEQDKVKGTIDDGKFSFYCTPGQFEDIADAFRHYKKIYYDYIDGAMISLIHKNEIKNTKPAAEEFKMESMTEEELNEYNEFIKESRPDKETETSPPKNPQPTPTPDVDTAKKDDRIRRMFMVMEQSKWTRKVKPKYFLS